MYRMNFYRGMSPPSSDDSDDDVQYRRGGRVVAARHDGSPIVDPTAAASDAAAAPVTEQDKELRNILDAGDKPVGPVQTTTVGTQFDLGALDGCTILEASVGKQDDDPFAVVAATADGGTTFDAALPGSEAAATTLATEADAKVEVEARDRTAAEGEDAGDDAAADMPDTDMTGLARRGGAFASTVGAADPIAQQLAGLGATAVTNFTERARWIPLRLEYEERKQLRLVEAALYVSEYTDKVDVISWKNKVQRIHKQLKEICAILCGLVVANDYKAGQKLIQDKQFKDNATLFQTLFEIARRYKIMNPEKMRSEYGKLLYLLQDAASPEIEELMQFSPITPIKTVYSLLESEGALAMLRDPLVLEATREVLATSDKPRHVVQTEIARKNWAAKELARKYSTTSLSEDSVLRCLYSISDNNSYLTANVLPVERMIQFLKTLFRPDTYDEGFSLAISAGRGGARLSHDHARQYQYVLQSLSLWSAINNDMFHLWLLAEEDLLDSAHPYRLWDTGQGLNRVQPAARIARAMNVILHRVQSRVGSWIGSSMVHLGDSNVPNALMFIDKYTQVGRILNPLVRVIDEIPNLMVKDGVAHLINTSFGGPDNLIKTVLCDFFRHGFDGSGADNFYDAGSCIDGRLTSAWNWCSKLEKKPYFHVFLMAGFTGFDGDFQR